MLVSCANGITLNDRTIREADESGTGEAQNIDAFTVSMRNNRPYIRLALRASQVSEGEPAA
jgi:hypothetical protein